MKVTSKFEKLVSLCVSVFCRSYRQSWKNKCVRMYPPLMFEQVHILHLAVSQLRKDIIVGYLRLKQAKAREEHRGQNTVLKSRGPVLRWCNLFLGQLKRRRAVSNSYKSFKGDFWADFAGYKQILYHKRCWREAVPEAGQFVSLWQWLYMAVQATRGLRLRLECLHAVKRIFHLKEMFGGCYEAMKAKMIQYSGWKAQKMLL